MAISAAQFGCLFWPGQLAAQDNGLHYNSFGAPGLIDMPIAHSAPDAELATSSSHFAGQTRNTLTFQVAPRLSASIRYSSLNDIRGRDEVHHANILDRSFALHYRILDETPDRPALAIGVNDFIGTGVYAGEYLVATKSIQQALSATVGLGWGRLAGVNSFANPLGPAFADRPAADVGEGGTLAGNHFFRGDAAVFAGFAWSPRADLSFQLEYASDNYPLEDGSSFNRRKPVNIGLTYAPRPGLRLSARYLYASELGVQLSYVLNPTVPPFPSGLEPGPLPVSKGPAALDPAKMERAMAAQGLRLVSQQIEGQTMRAAVENRRHVASAQAIGRAARVMSATAPESVGIFAITLVESGLFGAEVAIIRADLAAQEFALDGAADLLERSVLAPPQPLAQWPGQYQGSFDWGLHPYITPNLFDPDAPLRADLGLALDAHWVPAPGFVLAGSLRQRIAGNLGKATRMSDSVLPHVRSDFALYDREGDLDVARLTAARYWQPAPDITGRITAGYLEDMFAGLSVEVLWAPTGGDLALGIEVNHVRQRDYAGNFDLLAYRAMTGHASAYLDLGKGYHGQLDIGRYLAGDWGGTITLNRRFRNGWSVGAFATLTDVPFQDFGEGSFDKGIVLRVPVAWIGGQSTRDSINQTLRPVTRDGGARLKVDGRLYDLVRPIGREAITESWGRVWR